MLTKTMALELGKNKIRVNSVNLGLVMTEFFSKMEGGATESTKAWEESLKHRFPLGQVWIPIEEAVRGILFVSSGATPMVTGAGFVHDGGYCAY